MPGDSIDIDLTNYKDKVGSRIMPGRYRVLVEDAESDTSSNNNPMVNLWFRVMGGEFDGSTIVDRLVITEKSMFRVVGFMQAIGMQTPKKRLRINIRQFVGKVLDVDVDDGDPYNGRVKSEVRGYMRVEGKGQQEQSDLVSDDPEADIAVFTGDSPASSGVPEPAAEAPAAQAAPDEPISTPAPTQQAQAPQSVPDVVDLDSIEL